MSRLSPETLPIWQHLIIMMSGRSRELWGLLSQGAKWSHSSITHHLSLPVFNFKTRWGASICRGQKSLFWLDGSGGSSSAAWEVDCLGHGHYEARSPTSFICRGLRGREGCRLRLIFLWVSCHDCSLGLPRRASTWWLCSGRTWILCSQTKLSERKDGIQGNFLVSILRSHYDTATTTTFFCFPKARTGGCGC